MKNFTSTNDATKAFLENGGTIKKLPRASAPEKKPAKRRGKWTAAKNLRGGYGSLS